uniref:Uncharacterized protein n=1 Tax=Arundo donax TaxID=35708 RepID=A0A0A9U0Y9_ARUDO
MAEFMRSHAAPSGQVGSPLAPAGAEQTRLQLAPQKWGILAC